MSGNKTFFSRTFQGCFIPRMIWLNNSLTLNQRMFIGEVMSLDTGKGCEFSVDHFTNWSGLSEDECISIVNSLIQRTILLNEVRDSRFYLSINYTWYLNAFGNEYFQAFNKHVPDGFQKVENKLYNNTDFITFLKEEADKLKESEK